MLGKSWRDRSRGQETKNYHVSMFKGHTIGGKKKQINKQAI